MWVPGERLLSKEWLDGPGPARVAVRWARHARASVRKAARGSVGMTRSGSQGALQNTLWRTDRLARPSRSPNPPQ